jgi:hypothetical protein
VLEGRCGAQVGELDGGSALRGAYICRINHHSGAAREDGAREEGQASGLLRGGAK